jgi:hypothetical protein
MPLYRFQLERLVCYFASDPKSFFFEAAGNCLAVISLLIKKYVQAIYIDGKIRCKLKKEV